MGYCCIITVRLEIHHLVYSGNNGSTFVNLGANDKLTTAQKEIVDAYRSKFRVALRTWRH